MEKTAELLVDADRPTVQIEYGDGFRGVVNQLFRVFFLAVQFFFCQPALGDVLDDTLVSKNTAVRIFQPHGGDETVSDMVAAIHENNRVIVHETRFVNPLDQMFPVRHIGIKGGDF